MFHGCLLVLLVILSRGWFIIIQTTDDLRVAMFRGMSVRELERSREALKSVNRRALKRRGRHLLSSRLRRKIRSKACRTIFLRACRAPPVDRGDLFGHLRLLILVAPAIASRRENLRS